MTFTFILVCGSAGNSWRIWSVLHPFQCWVRIFSRKTEKGQFKYTIKLFTYIALHF